MENNFKLNLQSYFNEVEELMDIPVKIEIKNMEYTGKLYGYSWDQIRGTMIIKVFIKDPSFEMEERKK